MSPRCLYSVCQLVQNVHGVHLCFLEAARWRWAVELAATLRSGFPKGLRPNDVFYNALISACASAGQWQLALQFLDEMPQLAVQTSIVSYNAAAEACQRALSWAGAIGILRRMRARAVQTDVITLSLLAPPCIFASQFNVLPGLTSQMVGFSKAPLQAQHTITAIEFLTEHACLPERAFQSFARLEWKVLVRKLRELCAPKFSLHAAERTSLRLLDCSLNRYFTLGMHFVDKTLGSLFAQDPHPSWSGCGRVTARRLTAEHAERSLETSLALEDEASAHGLATWIQRSVASLASSKTGIAGRQLESDGFAGVFGYGSACAAQSWLLPVNVQHDRSRPGAPSRLLHCCFPRCGSESRNRRQ